MMTARRMSAPEREMGFERRGIAGVFRRACRVYRHAAQDRGARRRGAIHGFPGGVPILSAVQAMMHISEACDTADRNYWARQGKVRFRIGLVLLGGIFAIQLLGSAVL